MTDVKSAKCGSVFSSLTAFGYFDCHILRIVSDDYILSGTKVILFSHYIEKRKKLKVFVVGGLLFLSVCDVNR